MLNPYQEYKKQSVMTMTPGDMIIKLYDECLAVLQLGIVYIDEKNIEGRVNSFRKAREIIGYLRSILNMDVEISSDLDALYGYYLAQITKASFSLEKEPIEEVIGMLTDLRTSFSEINKTAGLKHS